jgi:formylglycine-generating enzyme required for sulfatase activity/energy-coupling factor transporter ATP-binding protein EcfA2
MAIENQRKSRKNRLYWMPSVISAMISLVTALSMHLVAPRIDKHLEHYAWIMWLVFGLSVVATVIIAMVRSRKVEGEKTAPIQNNHLFGTGAIAQGNGAMAAGERGVVAGDAKGAMIVTGEGNTFAKNIYNNVIRSDTTPKSEEQKRALEANYLRWVQIVANKLPLSAIDPRAMERIQRRSMDLLPLYILLDTTTRKTKEGMAPLKSIRIDRGPEDEHEGKMLSALEAIAQERTMVLLGDPGSGKSTFVNYIALCLSGTLLDQLNEESAVDGKPAVSLLEPAWTHGALLPLIITLRQFAQSALCNGTAAGLWSFVQDMLAEHEMALYGPLLRGRLEQGGVYVLFDGLDEVGEPTKRKAVHAAVKEFVTAFNSKRNRFLVTCRGYAYRDVACKLENFIEHTLAPLNAGQITAFIDGWYKEACRLEWKSKCEAEELKKRLSDACTRIDLAPLAANPLQLAMMASLQFSWGRLPDDRVELYQEMVRLLLVRWQEARLGVETGITLSVKESDLESALEKVAFIVHSSQESQAAVADISHATLLSVFKELYDNYDKADLLVKYIQDRAGLLIDKGNQTYNFPHRSYQEYLAGCYLARQPDFPTQMSDLCRQNYGQWREVALWAAGVAARISKMPYVAVNLAAELCPSNNIANPTSEIEWRTATLAGEVLLEAGRKEVEARLAQLQVMERVRQWLVTGLERSTQSAPDRAASGRILAKLGDPREAVMDVDKIEFCLVPAGPFWMGDDKEQHFNECLTRNYWISRNLVTNVHYDAFVKDGGYSREKYWKEALAQGIWNNGKVKGRYEDMERIAPLDYGDPFNLPNHPVVGVSWYESLAFARWLTERWQASKLLEKKWEIRLPSEAEWEKAARGGVKIPEGASMTNEARFSDVYSKLVDNPLPKRSYPWGDDVDPNKANYDDSKIDATSAIVCFPGGASPYGVLDLSGNVWEWTRSIYKDYPYQPDDGREELDKGDHRVIRGGAFFNYRRYARCACRDMINPDGRGGDVGFRVVASPFFSDH